MKTGSVRVRRGIVLGAAIALVAGFVAFVSWPSSARPWAGTPETFEVNRLPSTARTIPVADAQTVQSVGATVAESQSPWLMSLNGAWSFRWSPDEASASLDFVDPATDVDDWDVVQVPHQWQLDGYGDSATGDLAYLDTVYPWQGYEDIEPPATPTVGASVGSYRREVTLPDGWSGRRTILAFQGVKSAFTVWVNGVEIGYSEDSYAPAEFEVTDALHAGVNTIAVRVFRWSDGSWLENQDQIDLSGIFRDVEMYSVGDAHLEDDTVTTDVHDDLQGATVTTVLDVSRAEGEADAVRVTLLDPAGQQEGMTEVVLPAGGSSPVEASLEVPDARLWTAETPDLYTLVYELLRGDEVRETVATRIGIREFQIVDGQMRLNGHVLDIKGVNRGEMQPDVGQALTEEQMRADLIAMRQANITAVRTSHYPASPTLYRLADEIGMYVMDEANVETHGLRPFPEGSPEWDGAVLDRISTMYERDKNHASVLWWSLGNEVGPGEVFARAADWLRATDPGRLVHFQEDSTVADIDGVFYPTLDELEARAQAGGARPWIMTEYQMAMGNSVGGIEDYWKVVDSSPTMQGGFVWDWADQAIRLPVEGGVDGLPITDDTGATYFSYGGDWGSYATSGAFELNGLVLPDRTPQPELAAVAAVYAPVELVDSDAVAGRVELRNENLVTDLAAYDVTWTLEADGSVVTAGTLDLSLAAGETAWVGLPVSAADAVVRGAEHVVTLEFRLKGATAWADAGFRVAALQVALPTSADASVDASSGAAAPGDPVSGDADEAGRTGSVGAAGTEPRVDSGAGTDSPGALQVRRSGGSVTVTGDSVAVAVDESTGALVSYEVDGRELLAGASAADFWRATTQNDEWNGLASAARQWRSAGANLDVGDVRVSRGAAGSVIVTVEAQVPVDGDPAYRVVYAVQPDGAVVVDVSLGAADTAAELPAMGVELLVDPTLTDLTWFGDGPGESWSDRTVGTLLGTWSSTVADQLFPQVVPQATGNHTGVRWISLTDASGTGLQVVSLGGPLQAAALPVSEAAIEAAAHPYQLVLDDAAVHLTIDAVQQGVGFSWGPRAVPSGTVAANEAHAVRWVLRGVTAADDRAAEARAARTAHAVD
ncbi:glycoside hydrolase family 2 TIM barrel-domain containing protein [Demequina capsici]|uniref:beta-galactosidase n=1 Tax=Demequina capsici TaxID=3075620 RepID=A0AA96FCK5_9MICO|nr:glycoside hydrolase family 2 TIM barrel-domain containing protein [Demequina sp. PMTSA13]WNM27663.1 glycoside hydrolase family 2 TIM barrel-domain containing protein [Demequina sp. PMTSA13]